MDNGGEDIDEHAAAEEEEAGEEEVSYNDEEAAEGEDPIPERPEPSEDRINGLLFRDICNRLEKIWSAKGRKQTDAKKLNLLIPSKMLADLCNTGDGVFPLYRLLLPHMDARRYNIGERLLADMYATALLLAPSSDKAKMLFNYADPRFVSKAQGQSDLSSVIRTVVQSHKTTTEGSDWTVGQINDMLDQFVMLPVRAKEMKEAFQRQTSPKRKKSPPLRDIRADWLRQLNNTGERKGLSAVEHKWLARILLKKMQFGLGWQKLLAWLHPHAPMAYTAKNNLRFVCNTFCDPEIRRQMGEIHDTSSSSTIVTYLPQSPVVPTFGSIFTPMLSERTGFDRVLDDISRQHRAFLKTEEGKKRFPKGAPLAIQHPAFLVEPKMDGERILVHVNRDGVLRMHTRNGNWYSNIYAPVLGPPLRRALPKNIDVILDGEVIAWDSHRQETVPFGNNRSIAVMRRHYLASRGMLDARDKNVHTDDSDGPFMPSPNDKNMDEDQEMAGSECWLQFVVFDIVYLDGEGMAGLLHETLSPHISALISTGNLTNLDLFERKKLLYKVLETQKDEVEIIQAWVIRPNGETISASEYFDTAKIFTECGHPACQLDSQTCVLSGAFADLEALDIERRNNLTDEQISIERALSIQHLYDDMVERQRLEGLIFKDLSTPYFLGQESKSLRFWLKFKPDYFNGSAASDLDLAVVGGYFATGLKHGGNGDRAGKPSALLVACVDSMDPERFFPICKVSVGSMDFESRNTFFKATGFSAHKDSEEGLTESKWFRLDKKTKETPEFITSRSFQPDQDGQGWRMQKKDYPDEWIHPDDCPVLALNAGEVVESDTFSAGLSLRFPRVTRVRTGADRKSSSDVETEHSIWKIYQEIISSRASSNALTSSSQPMMASQTDTGTDTWRTGQACRFLTERQHAEKKRTNKKRAGTKEKLSVVMPDQKLQGVSSKCLEGLRFAVLGNRFHFDARSDEYECAQEQGWLADALKIKSRHDMENFIVKHGGSCVVNPDSDCNFVIGNFEDDIQVETHIRAIKNARAASRPNARTKKAARNAKLAQSPGVIRWTFVISLVRRCRNEFQGKIPEDRGLLNVSVLDFLSRPEGLEADSTLYEIEIPTTHQMQRALQLVGKTITENPTTTWFDECIHLPPEGRWVASCGFEPFWPFQKGKPHTPPVVIYPDIFRSYGLLSKDEAFLASKDDRWGDRIIPEKGSITCLLPLVHIMGAMETCHFHQGVTHVLTDKVDDMESGIDYLARNRQSGCMLAARLLNFQEFSLESKVVVVSPKWMRRLWDTCSS